MKKEMINEKCKMKNKKGFSLVELLVVITIMAILSVVAFQAFGGQTARARNGRRIQDVSTIQSALEIYFIQNSNQYPPATSNLSPNYIKSLPTDPLKETQDYTYEIAPDSKAYALAATMEDEAGGSDHTAYVIGNNVALMTTKSGRGYYYNTTDNQYSICTATKLIVNKGMIAKEPGGTDCTTPPCSCLPYTY